jgi:ATP-binding cassette subfamily C exporter for protease/lipase
MVMFLLVMAFAEFIRSRLLVRAGMRFDELMNRRVFAASFDAHTAHSSRDGLQVFNELTRFRQFVTGSGIIALSDMPWSVIYVGVLFLMHPVLGWFATALFMNIAIPPVKVNTVEEPTSKIRSTAKLAIVFFFIY